MLSETATTRTIRNSSGVVLEHWKLATSMPHFIEFPVKNLADFERLKATFGVDWVLVAYPQPDGLPCHWHNDALAVCQIP